MHILFCLMCVHLFGKKISKFCLIYRWKSIKTTLRLTDPSKTSTISCYLFSRLHKAANIFRAVLSWLSHMKTRCVCAVLVPVWDIWQCTQKVNHQIMNQSRSSILLQYTWRIFVTLFTIAPRQPRSLCIYMSSKWVNCKETILSFFFHLYNRKYMKK